MFANRPVRLKFVDLPVANPARLLRILRERFEIELVRKEPDYVIYSVFGNDYLKYPNAIRIFFTGENIYPDFNLCDYAFGFHWLQCEDRYYRCPNYKLYDEFEDISRRKSSIITLDDLVTRRFCNFVYSNTAAHPYRDRLFHEIHKYRHVDSAGAHLNNMGPSAGGRESRGWEKKKVNFQRTYKFSIACENSSTPGYTTEKIVHALAADTIPIYFGDPLIAQEFNPRRFINCHDYNSLEEVVERVRQVDQNDDLYLQIISEPFFNGGEPPAYLSDQSIAERFAYIFNQPKDQATRRNSYAWGPLYEKRRRFECESVSSVLSIAARLAGLAAHLPEAANARLRPLRRQLADLACASYANGDESWKAATGRVKQVLASMLPPGERIILIDNALLQASLPDYECISLMEEDGVYAGPPARGEEAVAAIQKHIALGMRYVVICWPAFWWLDTYEPLRVYLERFHCVRKTADVMFFDVTHAQSL